MAYKHLTCSSWTPLSAVQRCVLARLANYCKWHTGMGSTTQPHENGTEHASPPQSTCPRHGCSTHSGHPSTQVWPQGARDGSHHHERLHLGEHDRATPPPTARRGPGRYMRGGQEGSQRATSRGVRNTNACASTRLVACWRRCWTRVSVLHVKSEFCVLHGLSFPEMAPATLSADMPVLAHSYLRQCDNSGSARCIECPCR